jgi:c-di-GMP-related signal transduction protein
MGTLQSGEKLRGFRFESPANDTQVSASRCLARQPILDCRQRTFGYELLFRSSPDSLFSSESSDNATRIVLDNLLLMGLDVVSDHLPAFVNCTRNVLTDGLAALLPVKHVILEVIETVEIDAEVVRACRDLKEAGHRLALDDFTPGQLASPLLELADFVKVDFLLNAPPERQQLARELGARNIRLVAEKVETREEFEAALSMGYELCQGFFFARPKMVVRRAIPAFKLNLLRILREVCRPDFDAGRLEESIKAETSVCYRLLKYLNSFAFPFQYEIKSLRHALSLLGENKVRQWLALVIETAMGSDKPSELMVTCLARARFCELLAPSAHLEAYETDLFLCGMLSMIDAILDQPLSEILGELGVSNRIHSALISSSGPLYPVLDAVLAWERGEWDAAEASAAKHHISEANLMRAYIRSIEWTKAVFRV